MLDDKYEKMHKAFCDSFSRIFPEDNIILIGEKFKSFLLEALSPNGADEIVEPDSKDLNLGQCRD